MSAKSLRPEYSPIGVVYLARFAEGLEAFERFARSYRLHPAGGDHDLIVLYKGLPSAKDATAARQVFRDIPHISVELEDVGYDIGSYLAACHRLSHTYLLFLNTYTEIEADGWLTHLSTHALREGVGIVGAMGSYESLFSSFGIIQSVIWMCNYLKIPYDPQLRTYCDFIIDLYCKSWVEDGENGVSTNRAALQRILPGLMRKNVLVACYAQWCFLTMPGQVFSDYRQFPSFPNPHIRSNGFMIAREELMKFDSASIQKKMDACAFESGINGLTTRIRESGRSAIIVGRGGQGYDVKDWWRGRLFRVANQEDLLVTDNQTRQFSEMSDAGRTTHVRMTWGDYLTAAPPAFPALPFRFRNVSLGTDALRRRTYARRALASVVGAVVNATEE